MVLMRATFLRRWRRRMAPRGGPSRTGQVVALLRAELDRPRSADGDPGAQRLLCAGMRSVTVTEMRPQMAARTRFFDEQVLAAISRGVRQVVICGAGYDDRALRFRAASVRYFELDQPATQADKARRLERDGLDTAGLTLVPADFRAEDVAAVLAASGQDRGQPTLFLCEGLLVYLDRPTIVRLLGGLASRAAAGSTLAASLAVHRPGPDSGRVAAAANARRPGRPREPWRTILPAEAHLALLGEAGWHVDQAIDAADLAPGLAPGRSLLVTARPGQAAAPPAPAKRVGGR
jgi:methyltransferase (TIGR00027 family)